MTTPPTVIINFVANIVEKTAGLLLYLLNDQLKSGVRSFRINISSKGGDVFYAVSLYNFLAGLKDVELHTHNMGQIDSGANLIFVSGTRRTASKASTFLLHPPEMSFQGQGSWSIEFIKERYESLTKDKERMAAIIAERVQRTKDEVLKMFDERGTYSSEEALALGWISAIEEFTAEPNKPTFTITNQA